MIMKQFATLLIPILLLCSCSNPKNAKGNQESDSFSFVFMTDIHLKPEMRAPEGFQMAIDRVNALDPDFVITGGDLVDDVLSSSYGRADTLYELYGELSKGFQMPLHNTMGNHEHYGYSAQPEVDPSHPEYGDRMFEKRIGKRYYSFDHQGWHFMILDGIEKGEGNWGTYVGKVDEVQLEWIREDLAMQDPGTPIVVVTHIPLVSVYPQINNGPLYAENQSVLVTNQREVLACFRNMNLKLVLQGHLHALEEITLMGKVKFITGGAVSGRWWNTPDDGEFQEGFIKVDVSGEQFTWEYVDYGWETGVASN